MSNIINCQIGPLDHPESPALHIIKGKGETYRCLAASHATIQEKLAILSALLYIFSGELQAGSGIVM